MTLPSSTWRESSGAPQVSSKSSPERIAVAQLALPDDQYAPAHRLEGLDVPRVAFLVSKELGSPKRTPRLRQCGLAATGMLMPKTSVNQDHFAEGWKDNIRTARQVPAMQSKSVSQRVRETPHELFGFGVLSPNFPHQTTALQSDGRINYLGYRQIHRAVCSH